MSSSMSFAWKRRCSFAVIAFYQFMGGIEYAIVFPTLWEYLKSLGVPEGETYYLGLCIAALSLTDMVTGLIAGRLADKFSRVSLILLALLGFEILASVLYLVASSPAMIVASRLVGGVGNVASIGLMADVCRVTTLKERTPVLVGFNIAQQLGLLFGPACNLFLREINFNIGGLAVNKLNAPGLFMALLYILLVCLAAAFYYDLAREAERERRARSREEREQQQIADGSQADGDGNDDVALINPDVSWSQYKNELIRGEVIALMFLRFIGIFGQTCLETMVTPLMYTYFGYDDFGNSLLYLFGGIELLFVSIFIAAVSMRVSDRSFILVGIVANVVFYAFNLCIVPIYDKKDRSALPFFGVGVAIDLFSISIILDITMSLVTKIVSNEVQGFASAVRRFFANLAFILGPLWGGGALPWLPLLFAVPMILLLIAAGLFVASYKQMVPRAEAPSPSQQSSDDGVEVREATGQGGESNERTPLLAATNPANESQA